jgi:hypothetical protein
MAAPYALEAARIAAASGLHAEVLRWTEAVRDHVDGQAEPALLSLRADALAAVGDHATVPAYRKALAAGLLEPAAGAKSVLGSGGPWRPLRENVLSLPNAGHGAMRYVSPIDPLTLWCCWPPPRSHSPDYVARLWSDGRDGCDPHA